MTALIIHPTNNFNTFIDVAEADIIAEDFLDHSFWDTLTPDDKQRWLLYTGQLILSMEGLKLPDTAVECLGRVQVAITIHQLKHELTKTEPTQQIKLHYFNRMSTEFFKNEGYEGRIQDMIPAESWTCLESVGVRRTSYAGGVGTVRKTR